MLESTYQRTLIKKIEKLLDGCLILKNDPGYLNGIPDLVVFYRGRYAFLEVKASEHAPSQPLQPHYVERLNRMSFAAFIYPSNEKEVLRDIEKFLRC